MDTVAPKQESGLGQLPRLLPSSRRRTGLHYRRRDSSSCAMPGQIFGKIGRHGCTHLQARSGSEAPKASRRRSVLWTFAVLAMELPLLFSPLLEEL